MAARLGQDVIDEISSMLAARLSGKIIEIYEGDVPASADDSSKSVLLAECRLGNVAKLGDRLVAESVEPDRSAKNSGIPGYFRVYDQGRGATVLLGTCGCGDKKLKDGRVESPDMRLKDDEIVRKGEVVVESFVVTMR